MVLWYFHKPDGEPYLLFRNLHPLQMGMQQQPHVELEIQNPSNTGCPSSLVFRLGINQDGHGLGPL